MTRSVSFRQGKSGTEGRILPLADREKDGVLILRRFFVAAVHARVLIYMLRVIRISGCSFRFTVTCLTLRMDTPPEGTSIQATETTVHTRDRVNTATSSLSFNT